ncbi:hypothetical protein DFP72DRAFT_929879 [Ephemerocybe angulata]|uniref:Uncharacterized protein n=1 Tax=Ephemerocybe angulata TaxID=980116 RepID=A0A8H6HC22_9AGAR|nr:hypothetical protein DFP72DRAFT_929879 [Tulosesus angulatus]
MGGADGALTLPSLMVIFSVFTNIFVTLLIAGRLLRARQQLADMGGDERSTSNYTSMAVMLIESAAPLSAVGLVYAILLGTTRSTDNDVLQKDVARII